MIPAKEPLERMRPRRLFKGFNHTGRNDEKSGAPLDHAWQDCTGDLNHGVDVD